VTGDALPSNDNLTRTELALLVLMQAHPGRSFSRQELIELVNGDDCPSNERTVDVHIASLRRKLGPSCIQTARGLGYFVRADRKAA
jgi:DNA-binding response OmpR family regulator